jgi:hypothetical protein
MVSLHLPPHAKGIATLARQRDSSSPLTRLGTKICPTLLARALQTCQGSSNFRLHSLSSRVSVALATPKFRDLIHLRSLNCATFGLKPLYREYSWQFFGVKSQYARYVRVGECHPKKIWCMLGALQSTFREYALLRKGGDALSGLGIVWVVESDPL